MLSILIPTYNWDITRLVNDLHQQAEALCMVFEIIVAEDGSQKFLKENKNIENLSFVNYFVLKENIGRSAIRNSLADRAKYDYLLFLDCDVALANEHFLEKYLPFCMPHCVVLGGRTYAKNMQDPEHQYSLQKKYGEQREQNDRKNLEKHRKFPIFTSPNFLIDKKIFQTVRFDETIKGYGHEDTIFGIDLRRQSFEFQYIDNPVVHIGLDDNINFINKTEQSLRNLLNIYQSSKYPELENLSQILSIYLKIKKFHLISIIKLKFKILKKPLYHNLIGKHPSLFLFDMYKLGIICSI